MDGVNRRKNTGKSKKTGERKSSNKPKSSIESTSSGEWLSSDDGLKLFVRHWIPQGSLGDRSDAKPRGVLHIVHGMAEHSLRYERLAQRLCTEGIEVWAADQRGHGKTADPLINDPSLGGLLGHCADTQGIAKVTADINLVTRMIYKTCPEIPIFLLGHSWGSFLCQNYIETYFDHPLAGCILSGTRGPDGLKIRANVLVMRLLTGLQGVRRRSSLARTLVEVPFNKPFKPNRTPFDWLSRDEQEVDAYMEDPASGILCSIGFYRDMSLLLNKIHRPEMMDMIKRNLPIYVFGGSADPVGDMGDSPIALVNGYRSLGIKDLEFVLYPDARHETLNETNREEVTENLVAWILKHCGRAAQ
ncbi:MAG: lysophospholipase [Treponema sp.]|jgi:alpha-beta hydrolase superfamily lysophospholipase|nr:lysophospholipase [Treponema sp.]